MSLEIPEVPRKYHAGGFTPYEDPEEVIDAGYVVTQWTMRQIRPPGEVPLWVIVDAHFAAVRAASPSLNAVSHRPAPKPGDPLVRALERIHEESEHDALVRDIRRPTAFGW